jgi:raffinose/stachyose/melibiose transport system substrate-binding protein
MRTKMFKILSILLVAAFMLAACAPAATPAPAAPAEPAAAAPAAVEPTKAPAAAAPATAEPAAKKVTITWWHISTKDPALSDWKKMADDYMAKNPNVNIEITVLENEAFKTKLSTVMQSGEVPDIFQSWGGGGLKEQIDAKLLKDITADLDADGGAWRKSFAPGALAVFASDGKNYGVPWDMGMVGWWYNKDLFKKAGIENTPATWTEFLADVKKLKDAGITPISVGEGDTWTGMHIWSYLATRIGGEKAFKAAADRSGSFEDPAYIKAGEELKKLIDMKPFQDGFLGAKHDDMQAAFGNGKAAMELSGQWAPSVEAANSADKKGVANLGLFNFPAVEGGAGDGSDVVGGGNGFAIGKNATPEAIAFVKYLTSKENQTIIAKDGIGIPTVVGAEVGLTDPNMLLVQKSFASAKYFQLYYDQLLPSAMGGIINDSVQKLFAGKASPADVAKEIEAGAKENSK